MLGAIDELAEEEREVLGLVGTQEMTQAEAAPRARRLTGDDQATLLLPEVRRRWQQMCAVKADLHAPSSPRLLRGGCQGGVTPPGYPL